MYFDFNLLPLKNTDQRTDEKIESILNRVKTVDPVATIAWNTILTDFNEYKPSPILNLKQFENINQLTRITIQVNEPKKNYQITSVNAINQKIDILAVQPLTIETCKQSCQVHEVDVISLDLVNYSVTPGYVAAQVAVNRGIFFEICYTNIHQDPSKRSFYFSNVKKLVQQTRGHNLIFSSGALNALHIRRNEDIKIIAMMFGMTQLQAEAATGSNYIRLLRKAETRKDTILAAISVNKSKSITNTPMEVESDGNNNQNRSKNQNNNQNKRKNDESGNQNKKKQKKKKNKI
ncbi:unnamed protein product [Cunninghamella blakesleeana]